jgi:hypothetical protein
MNNEQNSSQFFKPRIVGMGVLIFMIGIMVFAMRYNQRNLVIGKQIGKPGAAPAPIWVASPVGDILKQKNILKLSADQIAALGKIESEWKKESMPLTEELQRRTDELKKYMDSVLKSRVTSDEIVKRAVPMSEATNKINTLREKYFRKALLILDDGQRKTFEASPPNKGGKK